METGTRFVSENGLINMHSVPLWKVMLAFDRCLTAFPMDELLEAHEPAASEVQTFKVNHGQQMLHQSQSLTGRTWPSINSQRVKKFRCRRTVANHLFCSINHVCNSPDSATKQSCATKHWFLQIPQNSTVLFQHRKLTKLPL